jgi:histidine triad (HIT) family protein
MVLHLVNFLKATRLNEIEGMLMEQDCVFCDIISDKKPASIVYSDEKVIAFMVIRPVNPGHLIVIPKTHAPGLSELDEETGAHMFKIALRIAKALKKSGIQCEGINLFLSDGQAANQEIFHVHLHVVPRFTGDGFGIKYGPNNFLEPPREELDKIATMIRNAL